MLLPGESKTISVMFFAAMSGTFVSAFSLKTEPPISFESYNGSLDIPMGTEWKNEINVLATVSTQDNNTIKRNKIVEYINEKVRRPFGRHSDVWNPPSELSFYFFHWLAVSGQSLGSRRSYSCHI